MKCPARRRALRAASPCSCMPGLSALALPAGAPPRGGRRASACRSPTPTSNCAPAPGAAIRSSSSPRATSGSRSSCATPTGSRCAPTAARSAGSPRAARDHAHRSRRGQDLPRHPARRLPGAARRDRRGLGPVQSEPMLKLWTSYRFATRSASEGTLGQVQGVFSGTNFWQLNLLAEPWSDQRLSPFFGIGFGRFKNFPNPSLVGAAPPTPTWPTPSSACATTSPSASSCAPTTRSTPPSVSTSAPANTAPGRGLSFFF